MCYAAGSTEWTCMAGLRTPVLPAAATAARSPFISAIRLNA